MSRLKILFTALACLMATMAQARTLQQAVRQMVADHPALQLVDIYKSLAQERFGPGHLVADTAAARQYLVQELAQVLPSQSRSIEPCGIEGTYSRLPLRVITDSLISLDEYFSLFLQGLRPVTQSQIEAWQKEWPLMEQQIAAMDLNLPNYDSDRDMIAQALAQGHYALHHSPAYRATYHPHYRIIRSDLLPQSLSLRSSSMER